MLKKLGCVGIAEMHILINVAGQFKHLMSLGDQ